MVSKDETISPPETASPPAVKTWLPLPWAIYFWAHIKRVITIITGFTLILAGIVMLVAPGPGIVSIAGGLAMLATEFAWARWVLRISKDRVRQLMDKMLTVPSSGSSKPVSPLPASSVTGELPEIGPHHNSTTS